MSKQIKAIILRKIKDTEILNEALNQLEIKYELKGTEIHINPSCKLINKNGFYTAEIIEDYDSSESRKLSIESNKILHSIQKTYEHILNEKINSIKRQNLENELLDSIHEEQKIELERKQKKELLRLENIRIMEKKALEQQIEKAVTRIIESSKKNGYSVNEKRHEKERVLVLVRR